MFLLEWECVEHITPRKDSEAQKDKLEFFLKIFFVCFVSSFVGQDFICFLFLNIFLSYFKNKYLKTFRILSLERTLFHDFVSDSRKFSKSIRIGSIRSLFDCSVLRTPTQTA